MGQGRAILDDRNQHVGRDCDPDLRLHGALAGAEECLDAQVLFDPLEEEFDLPAAAIELGQCGRQQTRVVGQEGDAFAGLVPDHDAAQLGRLALHGVKHLGHADLIAEDGRVAAIDRLRVAALEAQALLGADKEVAAGLVKGVQPCEIQVAAVRQIEGAGFRREGIEDADLVRLAVADVNERRNRAAQIEQRVQLDGRLGRPEWRPGVGRQTQIVGRSVGGLDGLFEFDADGLVGVQRSGIGDQVLRQPGVDLPGPGCVGIGQRIARDGRAETEVMKALAFRRQASFDVAQRLAEGQLCEGHRAELIEAQERFDFELASVACDAATKGRKRQVRHDPREHELALMDRSSLRNTSRKGAKSAPRSSNRDPAWGVICADASMPWSR